ncbi:MAG: AfsR/SARP family transcriptional regulator, partial [Gemmatimonadota bacterium]
MVRLTTLGRLDLVGSEGQVVRSVLQQPKRLALLVHLVVEGMDGYVRRDTVLGLFWPDHAEDRARNALNQAVHYLRRSLGRDVIVSRGAEELGVAEGALHCDAVEFQRRLDAGEAAEALALYGGEFLRGFHLDGAPEFERWLERRRSTLRGLATDAARRLSEAERESGSAVAAVHWARRVVEFTPYDERAARRLMELLRATGDRAGALRTFRQLTRRLAEHLDTEPSPETRRLAEAIRSSADAEETASSRQPAGDSEEAGLTTPA